MTGFDIERFEASAHANGIRYWDARQFMAALGYDSWAAFQKVLNRAIASCAQLGISIGDVFIPETVIDGGRVINSYRLTRFACFLVTMHADARKPEVAQAKVVLAALADALIEEQIAEGALERIEIRAELKAGETIMSGAGKAAGLQATEYGLFKDAGIRGMYNMPLRDLVQYKRAPGDKTLYDYMGKTELAANLFRVTQTAERINNRQTKGLRGVMRTAEDVGAEVRQVMIRSGGVPPEDLALEDDIGNVKKRIKSAHREMRKLDGAAPAKRRLPPKS